MSEHKDWIQQTTGIPLSPHFGGPKLLFFVRNDPSVRTEVRSRNVWFGPLSAFVTQGLTGNSFIDESIAGRTLLLNLHEMAWDTSLLHLFEVPEDCLPPLAPTCGQFGTIRMASDTVPLLCVMGDQQACLVGMDRGNLALNLGTSGSVLMHSGEHPTVVPTLLSNVLYSLGEERYFLLEGTINSVRTLFGWLESYLHIPHEEMRWEDRCVQSTKGILVPGINGLAAPYWTGELDNAFFHLEDSDGPNAFVRAAMESVGFLVRDIFDVMQDKVGIDSDGIIASGGYSKPVLLQFIADLLNKPIWNSREKDMTALGVARLVAGQLWDIPAAGTDEFRQERFVPIMSSQRRHQKISQWRDALSQLGLAGTTLD